MDIQRSKLYLSVIDNSKVLYHLIDMQIYIECRLFLYHLIIAPV